MGGSPSGLGGNKPSKRLTAPKLFRRDLMTRGCQHSLMGPPTNFTQNRPLLLLSTPTNGNADIVDDMLDVWPATGAENLRIVDLHHEARKKRTSFQTRIK